MSSFLGWYIEPFEGRPQSADWGYWVEIGVSRNRDTDGSVYDCVFWERGINFEPFGNGNCGPNQLEVGTYDLWRMSNSGSDWHAKVDFLTGNGFEEKHVFTTEYSHGVALGETEAKGNETGMHQEQRALQFKNDNGTWVDWPDTNCVYDNTQIYDWNRISTTAYDVDQSNHAC